MKRNWLKGIRIAVSMLFLFLTTLIFLNVKGLVTAGFINPVVYLQFVPSLIKCITLLSLTSAGFIIILILTVLFGRIYCSGLCPVGTLQDIFIFLKRKATRRKKFVFLKPRHLIRLIFLIGTIIFFIAGSSLLVNLLDPYSNYGKMMTNLFKPALIGINNLIAFLIGKRELVFPKPIELKTLSIASVTFSSLFLGIILFFSLFKGRQYCNLICPVGSLLGYVAAGSLFRIRLDENLCNSCGACQVKCKAGCIDSKRKKVDITRCIACFDCLNTCPSDGLKYIPASFYQGRNRKEIVQVDRTKRQFLFLTGSMLLGLIWKTSGQAERPDKQDTAIHAGLATDTSDLPSSPPPTPPGSISMDHFVQICTACHLCITTCPTQVLQPTLLEYGWIGFMQPQMNYLTSFCEYECNLCTQICPTGAILPLTMEEKKITQLGKSRFIKKECIVYTKNTACGACSEHCPTKAVYMIPYESGLTIPEINNEICIGCGACEYSCPTDPKAIVVDANRYHLKAKLPENSKIEKKVNYKEEFPF